MPCRPPRAFLVAGLAALAACTDHPVGPRPLAPEPVPPPVHAALDCRMDVRAATLACASVGPDLPPGASALIIGGQGANVRLASSGTSYDAAAGILRSDVTVENLMAAALGTDDGVFPAPEGVRVFFHTAPTVTEGTGSVTVDNPDGEDVFTAAGQAFFQYGGLLAPGDTSPAREWRFAVPATVTTFAFTVYVSATVPGDSAPGAALFLLSGTGVADTVDAAPATRLRVGVRGTDGRPAAGQYVEAQGVWRSAPPGGPEVTTTASYGFTDQNGIVEFDVRMGQVAGPARLVVSAWYLSLVDTARFTVLPGRTSEVQSLPSDTVVPFGGRVALRLATADRYGNPRSDTVSLAVRGPGTLEGSEVVAGDSLGYVAAVVTAGALADTTRVTVVPAGTVAAHAGTGSSLRVFDLDGSGMRTVRTTIIGESGYNGNMAVSWLGPDRLVYQDNNWDHTKQLYTVDLVTGRAARFLALRDWMEMENYPRASRDGSWVYFSGGTYSGWSMFRARADGTGKEPLSFSPGWSAHEWGVDPSPDGSQVVFVRDGDYDAGQLVIGDFATGEARPLDLKGLSPRWSPDGTQIAFVATSTPYYYGSGPAAVVNADGSAARALTLTNIVGELDWSPDGRYLVGGTGGNSLVIIEVATGTEVAVSYPDVWDLRSPAWRP